MKVGATEDEKSSVSGLLQGRFSMEGCKGGRSTPSFKQDVTRRGKNLWNTIEDLSGEGIGIVKRNKMDRSQRRITLLKKIRKKIGNREQKPKHTWAHVSPNLL